MEEDTIWTERGINFSVVTEADYPRVKDFLEKSFFPDEPIFRSTKLMGGHGLVDRYIGNLVIKYTIMNCLKYSTSLVATDKDGQIIGSR
jgi:hypothetical protein